MSVGNGESTISARFRCPALLIVSWVPGGNGGETQWGSSALRGSRAVREPAS